MASEPGTAKSTKKKAPPGANGTGGTLSPIIEVIRNALDGKTAARVAKGAVTGEAAQLAELVNKLLDRGFADSGGQVVQRSGEIDRAIGTLVDLVKSGDLSMWDGATADVQLAPLFD